MPILTPNVAAKLASRQLEKARHSCLSSIWGEIQSQDPMEYDAMIIYAKAQKKDAYYGWS